MDKYSGVVEIPETEKPMVEKKLYSLVLVLKKEGRITGHITLQPFRDAQLLNITAQLERSVKLIDALEKRVKNIEDLRAGIHR